MVRVLYFCVPSNHNTPSIGSDGFEKVLIGTRGAREAFFDGAKGRAAKNSVLTSGAKQLRNVDPHAKQRSDGDSPPPTSTPCVTSLIATAAAALPPPPPL